MNRPTILLASLAALAAACGDDDGGGTSGPPCTTTIAAGADDTTTVLTALVDAQPGDVLCFDGDFSFDGALSLTVDGITLRGVGAEPSRWDFSGLDAAGAEGLRVDSVDGFTFENIAIANTPGDGLRVQGSTDVTIRNAEVRWDGEPSTANGAYGFYPVSCTNVLMEDNYAFGASDAGIYVGQSTNVVVRNNVAEGNVAGIEIENCFDSLVYGNEMFDNTGGLVIFDLPGLPSGQGERTLAYDNVMRDNNRPNFAPMGAKVGLIPAGTGAIVRNMDDVELRDNEIHGNDSAGVIVLSEILVCEVRGDSECELPEGFDPYPSRTFIHDNTYEDNGTDPQATALLISLFFGGMIGDVFYDDLPDPDGGENDGLCVQESDDLVFAATGPDPQPGAEGSDHMDVSRYDCTHPPLDLSGLLSTVGRQ